ncbi:hypothetical protein MSj_02542 [Microcystis aeruginosa Sj]|uniref:NIDO domain-containing protein n=2 Tax=Microcystis aeruginosa TaxID=1126 RepID=A0A2Z6UQ93_MICAE|nr:hypothetical protein MSj_02542 [Microcystis aeruginosa Sj]
MTVVLHELDHKNVTLATSNIWSLTKMTVSTQKNNGFTHFCQNLAIGFVGLMSLGLSAEVSLADASVILNGFGGPAGFGELSQGPNDDGSSSQLNLPFNIDFFGSDFSTFFVNNNGNLTFVNPLGQFTPSPFPITNQPMIAPYWGDVDTRGTGAVYVASPNESTVVVTWDQVGYYNSQTDLLNTFQVVLRDRPDTGLDGNFDIEFRYGQLQWTTGSASGGSGGLGGTPAQAGFDAGDGINFFTLPGSRTSEVLNLANISNVSLDTPGLWSFAIRNGETPGSTPDNPLLPVIIEDGFQFDFNITEPDRPFFIDPDVAVGYNYIVDSGPNMTSVLLPTGIGDGFYELWSDSSGGNCTDFAFSGTTLTGGTTFNFASPLRCFSVRGIETSAGLDPANPLAFITGLTFESAGSVSMRQIPITVFVDDGTTQVPEPTTSAFIYAGLMGLGLLARKAK